MTTPSQQHQVSLPASRYETETRGLTQFMDFVIRNTERLDSYVALLDQLQKILASASGTTNQGGIANLILAKTEEPGALMTELQQRLPLQLELVFCRSVDNFLTYVSEILALVFSKRPEMLKSDEKISIATVLEYTEMGELIGAITERKVISLSFKGMNELNEDLTDKFGFVLFRDKEQLARACELVEKRNLFTHHRGCVNRRYLERVKSAAEKLGDKLVLTSNDVIAAIVLLSTAVRWIDIEAEEKFGIARGFQTQFVE